VAAGQRIVQHDFAETLRLVAREGAAAIHGGELGRAVVGYLAGHEGLLTLADLTDYLTVDRLPVRGSYRGYEVLGPPPPSSAGVHILQMLNVLEGFDVAEMGFGSPDLLHVLAETMKIAFADRAVSTADPDFVDVPVEQLVSKEYAAERRGRVDLGRTRTWTAGVPAAQSADTTHLNAADDNGNVVAATMTIHDLFGARTVVPGTGLNLNNYMRVFDPHPGKAHSIAPGKRVPTSQAPVIVLRNGRPEYAIGLPGGVRIFASVLQTLVNLIDHGMTLQEAVEAPRVWTQGEALEVEPAVAESSRAVLRERGHEVVEVRHVATGMNAIALRDDGMLTGAACWRADGSPIGIGGGLAKAGVRSPARY
jgi:gamma-glutamyltranspeptidase/glutathione hydrolase